MEDLNSVPCACLASTLWASEEKQPKRDLPSQVLSLHISYRQAQVRRVCTSLCYVAGEGMGHGAQMTQGPRALGELLFLVRITRAVRSFCAKHRISFRKVAKKGLGNFGSQGPWELETRSSFSLILTQTRNKSLLEES